MALIAIYYIVHGIFLSFYLIVCLDYRIFRKQFESILAQLEDKAQERENELFASQRIRELIKCHVFIKRWAKVIRPHHST